MTETYELWKRPESQELYMIVGWRQWADGGSISSGLPEYLAEQLSAEPVGCIRPEGFYLFQVPGTHDLVRPTIRFREGYPRSLESQHNDLFFAGDEEKGLLIFSGDEPHMDVERYIGALLAIARELHVKRIIGLGGVYGELPYDKERMVHAIYSLPRLKAELANYAVSFSDYQGGASIGSYLCRRAGEQGLEYVGYYVFVPAYDYSPIARIGSAIRLEDDYMAWLGVLRRIDYMFKLKLDLSDLEKKSRRMVEAMDARIEEIEQAAPQLELRQRIQDVNAKYKELIFAPLNDALEDELRHLLDKFD